MLYIALITKIANDKTKYVAYIGKRSEGTMVFEMAPSTYPYKCATPYGDIKNVGCDRIYRDMDDLLTVYRILDSVPYGISCIKKENFEKIIEDYTDDFSGFYINLPEVIRNKYIESKSEERDIIEENSNESIWCEYHRDNDSVHYFLTLEYDTIDVTSSFSCKYLNDLVRSYCV